MATTTQRGYGAPHQRERAKLQRIIARGGAFCCETECIMPSRWIEPGMPWDLAHDHANGGYLGPAHSCCNRAEAANRGNARTPRASFRSRRSGPRLCEICGSRYKRTHTEQRCCSRECGAELRRRNAPPRIVKEVPKKRITHGTASRYAAGCRCEACWGWYCAKYPAKKRRGPTIRRGPR